MGASTENVVMRMEIRGGLVWICLLAPAGVAAQSAPQGSATDTTSGEASTTATAPRWSMALGFRGGFDDNPHFAEEPQGSLLSGLLGRGSYVDAFSRGVLSLSGDASVLRYKDASDLNQFAYSLLGTGSFTVSPHTNLQLSQAFSSTLTGYSTVLADTGLVLPQALVHRLGTTGNLSHQLSPKTSLGATVHYERNTFPNGELVGGSEFGIGASGTRRVSANHSLSASYAFESSSTEGQRLGRHVLSGGWNATLRPRLTASATLGIVNYETSAGGDRRTSPQGSATLAWRYPRWNVDVRYGRSVSQAFGLGRDRLADVAGATIGRKLGKNVDLGASYIYSLNRDPSDASFTFTSQAYGGDVRWLFARNFVASAGYSGRRNEPEGTALPLKGNVWTCAVSYTRDWR